MIKALNWMFQLKDFDEHYKFLLKNGACLFIPALLLTMILGCINVMDYKINLIINILIIVLWILPFFLMSGYFWCLTDNIICRELYISASSIYNGKIDTIDTVTLPELNLIKLIWRGIASFTATFLLFLPIVSVVVLSTHIPTQNLMEYWNLNFEQTEVLYLVLASVIASIIPALLWNYARQDSVVAVWNLPKAIYIMSTYPLRYFSKAGIYIILSALYAGVIYVFSSALVNVGIFFNIATGEFSIPNVFQTVLLTFVLVIEYVLALYLLYINAYLLGTVAPANEW